MNSWTILFDLDGTLVETAPDLCAALNYVIKGQGLHKVEIDDIRDEIGHGARAMIRRAFSLQNTALSPKIEDDLFQGLLAYYAENIAQTSVVFPHVIETLERLTGDGATLAVCTNKTQSLSEALIEALALKPYFDIIVGRDATPKPKPDPVHIWETIDRANGDRALAIMVGDSNTDAKAAQAAGVPFVLLEYGYHGGRLADIFAQTRLKDAEHLHAALHKIMLTP